MQFAVQLPQHCELVLTQKQRALSHNVRQNDDGRLSNELLMLHQTSGLSQIKRLSLLKRCRSINEEALFDSLSHTDCHAFVDDDMNFRLLFVQPISC